MDRSSFAKWKLVFQHPRRPRNLRGGMKRQSSSPPKESEADALKISSEGEKEASVLNPSKVEPSGPERDVEGRDEGTLERKESAVDEVGRLTQIGLLSIDLGHCVGQSTESQKSYNARCSEDSLCRMVSVW
jgi:hypothetical protein